MTPFSSREAPQDSPGFDLSRTIRKIVLLAFALIQAVLVARCEAANDGDLSDLKAELAAQLAESGVELPEDA